MHRTLVEKYARPTPRYTSYPTAPHFNDAITEETARQWLKALTPTASLSLYIHIPFCDRLCWFCGCATKQTNRYTPVARYLTALRQEIATVGDLVDENCRVTAVHFGGGSPTLLESDDVVRLGQLLRSRFAFTDNAEISVEMDPNDLTEAKCDAWARIGVTRVSLGVQDFDQRVQGAINREQSYEQTRVVVEAMRNRGVGSVNLDMLYGLPYQTEGTVRQTAEQVLALNPERIALFGYAHVPWIRKHQRLIEEQRLPDMHERYDQAQCAATHFERNDYRRIGIDHFARNEDKLAIADRSRTLRRNFQGYTDDAADALIGLGASAIGRLPQGYVQNAVSAGDYQRRVETGLATVRGLALSDDDRMRGWLIERLMCDFGFSADELSRLYGDNAHQLLREAEAVLRDDEDGLLERDQHDFRVTERGRPFVRSIASRFDPYFSKGTARHSISV